MKDVFIGGGAGMMRNRRRQKWTCNLLEKNEKLGKALYYR